MKWSGMDAGKATTGWHQHVSCGIGRLLLRAGQLGRRNCGYALPGLKYTAPTGASELAPSRGLLGCTLVNKDIKLHAINVKMSVKERTP